MADVVRREQGPERPEVRTRAVVLVLAGAFLVLTIAGIVLWFMYLGVMGPTRRHPPASFPAPRLESDPAATRARYQARESRILDGYGWVDRKAGLVRIPIDQAMTIIAARGQDAYGPIQGITAVPPPPARAVPAAPAATAPGGSAP